MPGAVFSRSGEVWNGRLGAPWQKRGSFPHPSPACTDLRLSRKIKSTCCCNMKENIQSFNFTLVSGPSGSSHWILLSNPEASRFRMPEGWQWIRSLRVVFKRVRGVLRIFLGSRSSTGTQRLEFHHGLEYLVHVPVHSCIHGWMRRWEVTICKDVASSMRASNTQNKQF